MPPCCPLCRRCCPSPLPLSTVILLPPSIMIATAVHLVLPPIAPLLHQQQSSATNCAIHCVTAVLLPNAIALPSCHPSRRRCPLPLLPSIAIFLPLSIVIADAIYLGSPSIVPLLHWRRLSATPPWRTCCCNCHRGVVVVVTLGILIVVVTLGVLTVIVAPGIVVIF